VKRRVTAGYGILQPRVAVSLPGTNRSRYARLYGGEPGIDPYTRVASDVYQDVFGEGSFIGKGIYDVDAFEQALGARFPENRILSHDLLEGCYARAGLLSDVQLYEDYPAHYSADVSRRHRWIRGDWQLAGWLLRRVPGRRAGRGRRGGSLPAGQSAVATVAMETDRQSAPQSLPGGAHCCSCCWAGRGSRRPGLWTLSLLAILLLYPCVVRCFSNCSASRAEVLLRQHLAAVAGFGFTAVPAGGLRVRLSPVRGLLQSRRHRAYTLWRMLVTQQRLLEWNPSIDADTVAVAQAGVAANFAASFRSMWVAPDRLASAAAIHLALSAPAMLLIAAPILLLWFASPGLFAWWISRPLERREAVLSGATDRSSCARCRVVPGRSSTTSSARKDHWLPPDNYQKYRVAAVAHRTSPTNIGLSLLASLSRVRLRLSVLTGQLIARTANTLRTMHTLRATTGPLLQLVRHTDACSHCRPCTSRRWTAATSPGTC
jgi:cyclic beta-1,2-glucan synthetase